MGAFDKYTNATWGQIDAAGVNGVIFGAEKPVLEVEMNEMQEIQKGRLRRAVSAIAGNGVDSFSNITEYVNNGIHYIRIKKYTSFIVNGHVICLPNNKDIQIARGFKDRPLTLVWGELDVSCQNVTELNAFGDVLSETKVPCYFRDDRMSDETTKRKVVAYGICIGNGLDVLPAELVSGSLEIATISYPASASNIKITFTCKEFNKIDKVTNLEETVQNLVTRITSVESNVTSLTSAKIKMQGEIAKLQQDLDDLNRKIFNG